MPYQKTQWKDRTVERPRTYQLQDNGDGTYTLIPAPGTVYEPGTPVIAVNMNKIEQGIANATDIAEAALPKYGSLLAVYDGGTIDPNTTLEAVILTRHSNGPEANTLFFIRTFFYSAVSETANRTQLAIGYSNLRMYIRRYHNGTWYPWRQVKIDEYDGELGGNLKVRGSVIARGDIPFVIDGTLNDNDPVNKRSFRLDSYQGEFRIQALNDSLAWVRTLININHDGTYFRFNGNDVWHRGELRWNSNGYLEYNDGGTWRPVAGIKRVQRGIAQVTASNSSSATVDVTISSVNMNKSFVNVSSTGHGNTNDGVATATVRARLTSSNNLELYYTPPQLNGTALVSWEVIEFY